ncbi:MAG TPA: NAD(P)-dependent oxidoreductase [Streptosporangiaceae bacterium]
MPTASEASAQALDPVGVIGLGQMGLPVALRLLAAGYPVFGCSRRPPTQEFLDAGGQACRTPAEVADRCPAVVTLLPAADALTQVAGGLSGTTRRDGIWLEMSTIGEQAKRTAAEQVAGQDWNMLDCAVSGTPAELKADRAMIFSSGSRHAHDQALPVLQVVSPKVCYVGEFGAGIRAKYIVQLLLAGHSLIAAEALALARGAGLPLDDIIGWVAGSITSSAVFEQRGPQVLAPVGPDRGNSRARRLAADLTDVKQLARQVGVRTPALDQALAHLEALGEQSADEPIVALYRLLAPSRVHGARSAGTAEGT